MAVEKTLGGDRLGSGNKVQQELHNYGMNSFNQNRIWWSTAAPGLLYPCFKEIGTNFGTFDIDIDTFVRTLPTKGPLFGSFKMQVDLFNVPFRLYQGILHNNPTDIGMHMDEVYLPAMVYRHTDGATAVRVKGSTLDDEQVSTNSLIKYMGISGAGHHANYYNQNANIVRKFQCVPELGYYDIFKNYYSNKQEENAYVVTPGNPTSTEQRILSGEIQYIDGENETTVKWNENSRNKGIIYPTYTINDRSGGEPIELPFIQADIEIENLNTNNIYINVSYLKNEDETIYEETIDLKDLLQIEVITIETRQNNLTIDYIDWETLLDEIADAESIVNIKIEPQLIPNEVSADIVLTPFALKNIDKMRAKLLGNCELGDQVTIDDAEHDTVNNWGDDSGVDETGMPYIANVRQTLSGISWSAFSQTGLVTKTYQSDMFNNWLDNNLVDLIAQRTKIDTTSGGFTPDTLILQEKIYTYLNRVLVGGGTYYDWQEATYGEGVARMCEIPMYIGGMSTEIMFEEVIANNESKIDQKYQALGSLAGKGTQTGKKGGNNIHVRMDEPGYIIGIVSLTPRICQFQGNDWDRTELQTMEDLHKPQLDGIGFQDLMVENMAWWNTVLSPGGESIVHRDAVGKQTAWLHYQTAIDKCYGDFAKSDGYGFMVLSRQYDHDENYVFGVKDLTTYIDPVKYNYAFAYNDLAAQNFWIEIAFKCTSRRKMGAQQLPTL